MKKRQVTVEVALTLTVEIDEDVKISRVTDQIKENLAVTAELEGPVELLYYATAEHQVLAATDLYDT